MGTEPLNNVEEDDHETEGDASTTSDNLPDGWVEQEDPSSGQIYFYNSTTGETCWDRPSNKEEVEGDSLDRLNGTEDPYDEDDDNETEGGASNASNNLPDGRMEQEDPLNENFNGVEEGPSRNNNDDDSKDDEEEKEENDETTDDLPDGWTEAKDPTNGQIYYYNSTSGVTSWD